MTLIKNILLVSSVLVCQPSFAGSMSADPRLERLNDCVFNAFCDLTEKNNFDNVYKGNFRKDFDGAIADCRKQYPQFAAVNIKYEGFNSFDLASYTVGPVVVMKSCRSREKRCITPLDEISQEVKDIVEETGECGFGFDEFCGRLCNDNEFAEPTTTIDAIPKMLKNYKFMKEPPKEKVPYRCIKCEAVFGPGFYTKPGKNDCFSSDDCPFGMVRRPLINAKNEVTMECENQCKKWEEWDEKKRDCVEVDSKKCESFIAEEKLAARRVVDDSFFKSSKKKLLGDCTPEDFRKAISAFWEYQRKVLRKAVDMCRKNEAPEDWSDWLEQNTENSSDFYKYLKCNYKKAVKHLSDEEKVDYLQEMNNLPYESTRSSSLLAIKEFIQTSFSP